MMVEEELESERGSFMMQECGETLGELMELIKEQSNNQSCLLVTRGPPKDLTRPPRTRAGIVVCPFISWRGGVTGATEGS